MGDSKVSHVLAFGCFSALTGLPYVAWFVSFDDGATYSRPKSSTPIHEQRPQIELWRGAGDEYEAECKKPRACWAARCDFWINGERDLSDESRRQLRAEGWEL